VDALDKAKPDQRLYLTNSFRFGPGVANLANFLLRTFRAEKHDITGAGRYQTIFEVDVSRPYAVISRTNSHLFDEAVNALKAEKKAHFIGGVENYSFDLILDGYSLFRNDKASIKDPFLRGFASFTEMEVYAKAVEDAELMSLCKIVGRYNKDIPDLVDEIKKKAHPVRDGADIYLTTAHKSKGLEFDQVILADDYLDFFDENGALKDEKEIKPEEINILYVALTRAERALRINEKFAAFLEYADMDKSKYRHAGPLPAHAPEQPVKPMATAEPKHDQGGVPEGMLKMNFSKEAAGDILGNLLHILKAKGVLKDREDLVALLRDSGCVVTIVKDEMMVTPAKNAVNVEPAETSAAAAAPSGKDVQPSHENAMLHRNGDISDIVAQDILSKGRVDSEALMKNHDLDQTKITFIVSELVDKGYLDAKYLATETEIAWFKDNLPGYIQGWRRASPDRRLRPLMDAIGDKLPPSIGRDYLKLRAGLDAIGENWGSRDLGVKQEKKKHRCAA